MSNLSESARHIGIIGGGIGGLTAAMRLKRAGQHVTLFEASERLGGAICTVDDGPWRVEFGPNTLPDRGGVISALIHDLRLEGERLYPNGSAKKRYVVRDGRPVALPTSLVEFWKTPLFSRQAKLRLLSEPLVPPRAEDGVDESLYNFASRRLGQEVVDYALDPFIAGTYSGQTTQLSSRFALKRLRELEQEAGSLFRGGLRASRARKKSGAQAGKGGGELVNFKRGEQTLTDALGAELEGNVHLGVRITQAKRHADTGRWALYGAEGEARGEYDELVFATQAYVIPEVAIFDGDEALDLSPFGEINHPPICMMALGFRRDQVEHPLDGFGMLVPSAEEHIHNLGAVFASTIFTDRAPDGHVLLMVFFGGARRPEDAHWSEERKVEVARAELGELLGVKGKPVYVRSRVWPKSIPQYEVGYGRIIARIEALEATHPGLNFTGNWRDGIAVSDVVRHATQVAHSIVDRSHL